MGNLCKKFTKFISKNLENLIFDNLVISFLLYLTILPILLILYRSIFESSQFQGTPGKLIVGIKVVDYNFRKITFKQAITRNFIKFFSSIFYIGYLIALGNEKCLTMHDRVAKTYVVREIKYFISK